MLCRFSERSKTFNGKIIPRQRLVASPLDATDVSGIVKFCIKYNLSPSVKAGGYGIAGWAVAGDIVMDMSLMKDIDIEPPKPDSEEDGACGWTRIRDMPALGSKGKGRAGVKDEHIKVEAPGPTVTSTKRRREDDDEGGTTADRPIPNYDNASQAVAAFLKGPALPIEEGGEMPRQPPTNRRRLHSPEHGASDPQAPVIEARQLSNEYSSSSDSRGTSTMSSGDPMSRETSSGTAGTSPVDGHSDSEANSGGGAGTEPSVPAPLGRPSTGAGPSQARPSILGGTDPFAYMSNTSFPSVGSSFGPSRSFALPPNFAASLESFGVGLGLGHALPHMNTPAPPRHIHPHAYVTFGAGALLKEIDLFTSENLLEGISGVTGEKEDRIVPYHVPSYVLSFLRFRAVG